MFELSINGFRKINRLTVYDPVKSVSSGLTSLTRDDPFN